MAISGIETGSSQEAPPVDLDPEHSGNIWDTVAKRCNIAQVVFGLMIFILQVAWLGLGDARLIGLLWVGPLVSTSGGLNLNKRCTSPRVQKATIIIAVLSPLSIIICVMFATITGIHESISADVFIVSGSLVMVCAVALPVSLLSGTDTWLLLTAAAKQQLETHVKDKPPGLSRPSPSEQIPQPAPTAQPTAQPLPPPMEVPGTIVPSTVLPPTVEDLNHPGLSRPSSDGYEKPVPTRRPRRFRKPKQIPTEVDGTRRALPDVPTNDSEDDSEEEFILNEGYMTPSCEVLTTAHASTNPHVTSLPANIVTSQCGAKINPPKMKPLSKNSSGLSNPNAGRSQQPMGEIVEYNEIPSSTEYAVYSDSMAITRIKPSSQIEPYSVSEVVTGLPVEIPEQLGRVESPTKVSSVARGDQGGSPDGAACRVTEVTQEFGVRMIVTRQEVRDDGRYEEINDTDNDEKDLEGHSVVSVHDQERTGVISHLPGQSTRDSGYLEPTNSPKKGSFLNETYPISATKDRHALHPSGEVNNTDGTDTTTSMVVTEEKNGEHSCEGNCSQCGLDGSSRQVRSHHSGHLVREGIHKDTDEDSIVGRQSFKDSSYTHLQSDLPTATSHAYQQLITPGKPGTELSSNIPEPCSDTIPNQK